MIAVAAILIIAILAAVLWYYVGRKGEEPEKIIPLTSDEKRTILNDLSVPEGDVLPVSEKQKILEELSAPTDPSAKSAQPSVATQPQVNDQEKLKLLELLKNQ